MIVRVIVRNTWMSRLSGLILILALTSSVACGGGDDAAVAPATDSKATTAPSTHDQTEGSTVNVALGEWSIEILADHIHSGNVVFEVTNNGTVPHELAIVITGIAVDALPTSAGSVDETQVEVVGRVDQMDGAGKSSASWTLQAGSYVLICNIPGHYDLGMRTVLTIE